MLKHLTRQFSAAPYNPMKYLQSYIPTKMPTSQQIHQTVRTAHSQGGVLVQNLRQINPVRSSGAIPPFHGPFTMQDLLENTYQDAMKLFDICYPSQDTQEIMRRVPGVTREQAEYIKSQGFTPDQEIQVAWWFKNIGWDIYYPLNLTYTVRQVVTNQKGEKVEIMWPFSAWEDCVELSVDSALQDRPYFTIRHWEAYSGDQWYKYVNNQDLGVPDTWFEYDKNTRFFVGIISDQLEEPSDQIREWGSPRHPNARKEYWAPQEDLRRIEEMAHPDWVHKSPDNEIKV